MHSIVINIEIKKQYLIINEGDRYKDPRSTTVDTFKQWSPIKQLNPK